MDVSHLAQHIVDLLRWIKSNRTVSLGDSEDDEGPELAVELVTPETILIDHSNSDLIEREINELAVHFSLRSLV